jgi:hypothetical protein
MAGCSLRLSRSSTNRRTVRRSICWPVCGSLRRHAAMAASRVPGECASRAHAARSAWAAGGLPSVQHASCVRRMPCAACHVEMLPWQHHVCRTDLRGLCAVCVRRADGHTCSGLCSHQKFQAVDANSCTWHVSGQVRAVQGGARSAPSRLGMDTRKK